MNKVAVAVLTCERLKYTMRTVNSFLWFNRHQLDRFDLYYGDDASKDRHIHTFMADQGFEAAQLNEKRRGCSPTSNSLVHSVARLSEASHILVLQNDWESVRGINFRAVDRLFMMSGVRCVRLYGRHKDREALLVPTQKHLGVKGEKPKVKWKEKEVEGELTHIGRIHWCFNPNIVDIELAQRFTARAKRESHVMKSSANVTYLTACMLDNVMYHIGDEQTPDGNFGKG